MSFRPDSLELSESTFIILRDLIHERTGLYYESRKRDLLADKVYPRLVDKNFDSFLDYYYLLKYDPDADGEWKCLMDALSVSETFFWREFDQVRVMIDVLLPSLIDKYKGGSKSDDWPIFRPIQIWCAACSTGEEPISIAMALEEAGWFDKVPINIYGTDASPRSISKAKEGLYRQYSFRATPPKIQDKYFDKEGNNWRIKPSIHKRITWQVANITCPHEMANFRNINFIFCRNIFIYFSDQSIQKTVKLLSERMAESGYLFVSASESLLKFETDFKLVDIRQAFAYQKKR
ncbi:CheR family methyltransferase [Arthrospira platensis]|jgi:chemotaxis protein methyltransferase CheR|uniref:protein-glutamate O-methyltransferase n=1 Tax=Limnospira platensis NIES-46 TaxID=1236695 RepID=A0A5M3T6G6_LIMPL|nr:protein-glutamate O-methyltransferase CheR [Arthrospira platensis]KDR55454.1 chemotaxis protein CheR [Arthrospira platensis str. Paraca]MBD2709254.1 protein-glutamate O-methyltransferase CheR [Arthrospira platensis FACHB-835]MDF2211338.1 protein-glutamate O-methyltransferase CheR [Arthrospira platensis NCB002]MDT9181712.1 protein-glutamate O-methyltransferase CheR [Limnospira sp. PMC 289.06]MDT9294970.1 protein-glutamate O-methyltransferase CheR [Arthrospira platensis PCC 7345]MDT9309308.1